MGHARVTKIRPVSWKVYVQGEHEARRVRQYLADRNVEVSDVRRQPDLLEPPVFAFTVTPSDDVSFTTEELEALLAENDEVSLEFEED